MLKLFGRKTKEEQLMDVIEHIESHKVTAKFDYRYDRNENRWDYTVTAKGLTISLVRYLNDDVEKILVNKKVIYEKTGENTVLNAFNLTNEEIERIKRVITMMV